MTATLEIESFGFGHQAAPDAHLVIDLRRHFAVTTVIASLHHDNQMLRSEHHPNGTLTPLPSTGPGASEPGYALAWQTEQGRASPLKEEVR